MDGKNWPECPTCNRSHEVIGPCRTCAHPVYLDCEGDILHADFAEVFTRDHGDHLPELAERRLDPDGFTWGDKVAAQYCGSEVTGEYHWLDVAGLARMYVADRLAIVLVDPSTLRHLAGGQGPDGATID